MKKKLISNFKVYIIDDCLGGGTRKPWGVNP
jgi:hypothetical protein